MYKGIIYNSYLTRHLACQRKRMCRWNNIKKQLQNTTSFYVYSITRTHNPHVSLIQNKIQHRCPPFAPHGSTHLDVRNTWREQPPRWLIIPLYFTIHYLQHHQASIHSKNTRLIQYFLDMCNALLVKIPFDDVLLNIQVTLSQDLRDLKVRSYQFFWIWYT